MIRLRGVALGPALRDLCLHGSTPEREAAIVRSFSHTRPFVLAIWVLPVITAYVGIAKPDFGVSIQ